MIASTVPPQSIVTDWVYFNPMIYVLYAVDLRRNINFRYFGSGSPFEYDLVRFLYTKQRELQLRASWAPRLAGGRSRRRSRPPDVPAARCRPRRCRIRRRPAGSCRRPAA